MGTVNHCRIRSRQERGQTKYYLIEPKLFDSLYNLITYYRSTPLKSHDFHQLLTEPVPQPQSHKGKEYDDLAMFHLLVYHISIAIKYSIEQERTVTAGLSVLF